MKAILKHFALMLCATLLAVLTVATIDKFSQEPSFLAGWMKYVWLWVFIVFYGRIMRAF
jgi:hypothetical protein